MVSELSGDRSGIMLGVSSRGVREIRMMSAKGFAPKAAWTAQDVADHADDVFFPGDPVMAM